MSVAGYKRVKSPKDERGPCIDRVLTLGKLDLVSKVSVSEAIFDRQHVRVISDVAIPQGDCCMAECDEAAGSLESSDSRSITSFGDLIQPYRHNIDVVILPNAPFQVHAFLEVIERNAFSDCELVASHKRRV